jgi:hypothetical protein
VSAYPTRRTQIMVSHPKEVAEVIVAAAEAAGAR